MRELWRGPDERPRVYGHRGTRGHAGVVENTLDAFALALDQGADGVELDVRLCGSGELVVLHDPDLTRTFGQALVAAETPLQELAAAGVPTLDAALDLVAEKGGVVNVEAKPDVPDRQALVDALVRLLSLREAEQRGQVFVSSFSRSMCRALSEVLADVPVLWLFSKPPEHFPLLSDLPAVVGIHPKHTLIDAETLPRYRQGASVVNAWTVNDAAEARRLAELGVDGLITDDVPAVLEALGEVDPV